MYNSPKGVPYWVSLIAIIVPVAILICYVLALEKGSFTASEKFYISVIIASLVILSCIAIIWDTNKTNASILTNMQEQAEKEEERRYSCYKFLIQSMQDYEYLQQQKQKEDSAPSTTTTHTKTTTILGKEVFKQEDKTTRP